MRARMGILGPAGTHSEAAGTHLCTVIGARECVLFSEIFEVLRAVETGAVDTAFVPVENSLEGAVTITLDTLAHSDALSVVGELIWPVHNQLLGHSELKCIQKVYSHAQPLSQCREFLQRDLPHAQILAVSSTAKAAEIAARARAEEGVAAIATARAGEIYQLPVIRAEIQENMANCTRFFEVCRAGEEVRYRWARKAEKMLAICQMDGKRAGALYEVLGEFARFGVNMTRIESRPARTELGAYIFFFDLEAEREAAKKALDAVRKKVIWVKCVGEFPVMRIA